MYKCDEELKTNANVGDKMENEAGCSYGSLDGGFPTDTAATSCSLGLRVVLDRELRADKLSDIVDCATSNQCQADAVDQDGHTWMNFKLEVIVFDLFCDLHFVLVSMTSSWFYGNS